MYHKSSISIQLIVLGLSALFALSGQAMATTTDLGAQTAPSILNFGNTFNAPQSQFYDEYMFSITSASVFSVTSTFSLGNIFGINNLQSSLYSGTLDITTGRPASGALVEAGTVTQLSGPGYSGIVDVISPITLGSGNYVLEVGGNVSGTAGGSYTGTLNISPVDEPGEWVLLLFGLGLIGFIATRRRRNARLQSGMNREGATVIDAFIDALSWGEALRRISVWARARESRYVCLCNVHSVVTASHDVEFKRVVSQADMATPDGMPVAWMLRRQGFLSQERINGPDLMWKYCAQAARSGEVVYFYGSTTETLQLLSAKLQTTFPELRIGGVYAPPFREASEAEEEAIVASINGSGAGVVFVSLGCPKQEKWMAAHRNRIHAVMIGVGAAFDFHAGTMQRAPLWMQRYGLEWLHRLCSEPRRLWKRYLVTNTLFIIGAGMQLLQHELGNMPKIGDIYFNGRKQFVK